MESQEQAPNPKFYEVRQLPSDIAWSCATTALIMISMELVRPHFATPELAEPPELSVWPVAIFLAFVNLFAGVRLPMLLAVASMELIGLAFANKGILGIILQLLGLVVTLVCFYFAGRNVIRFARRVDPPVAPYDGPDDDEDWDGQNEDHMR